MRMQRVVAIFWVLATACGGGSKEDHDAAAKEPSDASQACADGSCCDTPCGAICCSAGAICMTDGAGNKSCEQSCTTSAQCPTTAQCCMPVAGGGGVCVASQPSSTCLCTTNTECPSAACAPQATSDVPTGPYVCKPNDGQAWDGCNGAAITCGTGYDCWADANQNHFCARSCSTDATCGSGACCNLNATCDNDVLSCGGPGGCMPCP